MESPIPKLITEALKTHEKIIIFTQDPNVIRDFITEEPGRFTVKSSEAHWGGRLLRHPKIQRGILADGVKASVVDEGPADIGIDRDARIVFSKDPFREIPKNAFVIKDTFSFPKVRSEDHFPPILAIQREGQPIAICADGVGDFIRLHDQFVMQEIKHSLDGHQEVLAIHLMKRPSFITGIPKAVVYGFVEIEELITLNLFDEIILVRPKEIPAFIKPPFIRKILQCFTDTPTMALSEEYIGFKTLSHPGSIKKALLFLERIGAVVRARMDTQRVVIHKKGAIPDDISFHAIPEGEHSVGSLMKQLRIPRENVISLLKRYEGNGLIFSYIPVRNHTLWILGQEVADDQYDPMLHRIYEEESVIARMISEGEATLNSILNEKIERHCTTHGTDAVLINFGKVETISPKQRELTSRS